MGVELRKDCTHLLLLQGRQVQVVGYDHLLPSLPALLLAVHLQHPGTGFLHGSTGCCSQRASTCAATHIPGCPQRPRQYRQLRPLHSLPVHPATCCCLLQQTQQLLALFV
jgi:hypothetical protein